MANVIATSIDLKKTIRVMGINFDDAFSVDYNGYIPTAHFKSKLIKLYVNHISKIGIKIMFTEYGNRYDELKNELSKCSNRNMYYHCWPYFDFENVYKYQDDIRKIISPQEKTIYSAKVFIDEIRRKYDTIVGVHIRRTDYKYWMEGKYYFEIEVYKKIIERVNTLFSNKNVGVIVFSDENIEQTDIVKIDNVFISHQKVLEDMMSMSLCDYLIGPPSTFSGWASYYGNVPKYYVLDDKVNNLSIEDFYIYMLEATDDYLNNDGAKELRLIQNGLLMPRENKNEIK